MTNPQDPHQQPEPPQWPPAPPGEYPPGSPPPAAPKRGMATWKLVTIIVASLLGLCCVSSLIIGLVAGPPSRQPSTHKVAAPAPTTAAAKPAAPATSAAVPTTKPAVPPPPAPTTKAAAPAPPATPAVRDREICRVTDNGGAYYLLVTSATEHDFRACAGHELYAGTLDDLFNVPNMDRRCILPNDSIAVYHALVGVYSDTTAGDLAAAQSFCDTNRGTNA